MFVYTDLAAEVIADIADKVPAFSHLDPDAIAVAAAARWAGSSWGNLATCMSLAAEPEPTFAVWVRPRTRTVIEVSTWYRQVPAEIDFAGSRRKYLILLRLPRMLENRPLETLVHELFHISERFDGELRPLRHGKLFDWSVRRLMREWLSVGDPRLTEPATLSLADLRNRYGSVLARRLPGNFQPTLTVADDPPCSYEEGIARLHPGYRLAPDYGVNPMKLSSPRTPRRITDDHCVLRNYHATGSEDVSRAFARYLDRTPSIGVG